MNTAYTTGLSTITGTTTTGDLSTVTGISIGGLTSTTLNPDYFYMQYRCPCGNIGCSGCNGGSVYTTSASTFSPPYALIDALQASAEILEFTTKVKSMKEAQLNEVGSLVKYNITRYKALDKACNIAREIGLYDNAVKMQKDIWESIKYLVGHRNYKVRDAIWDAIIALSVKKDIDNKTFQILYKPILLMNLAGQ